PPRDGVRESASAPSDAADDRDLRDDRTAANDRRAVAERGAPPPEAERNSATPAAAHARDTVAGIRLSNPDKLLYPEAKLAKRDLAHYYAAVGEWMLPHLRDRPLTLVRHPNGWDRKGFYQKNADDSMHAA